jgi:glycosyltransferase involved in cell wall biosynthesis
MLITIVTPTLNSERYIEETLRSIWTDDTIPGETLEHIVVDGESTDRTVEIASRYPSEIIVGRDGGMYEAINKGLQAAKGEIFGYVNSDDQLTAAAVAEVRTGLGQESDHQWIVGPVVMMDANGRDLAVLRPPRWLSPARFRALGWNCFPQPSTFYRTKFARELGGYDATYRLAADYDFAMRALDAARPLYASRPLSRFRLHESNLSKDHQAIETEARAIASEPSMSATRRRWLQLLTKVQVNTTNPRWAIGKLTGSLRY